MEDIWITLNYIREERGKLERQIEKLIHDFELETDMNVSYFDVSKDENDKTRVKISLSLDH